MSLSTAIVRMCAMAALAAATSAGSAHALSADDLMGRWCGENIFSIFTPETLTITFLNTHATRVLRINELKVGDDSITVTWNEQDGGGTTEYIEFTSTG